MKRTTIAIGIGAALLVALLLFTVARKQWWVNRIRARWVMNRFVFDDVVGRWIPEVSDYRDDLSGHTLASLINTWQNGEPGWYRVGEEPPAPPSVPFYQQPLGVPILAT